ncbi:hypothetical protein M422DRAFT_255099 [Sphaerobolus stellatus SS14]|uniref:Uncharacterized protein n=1 Tax=Sphaerobolus stellatus (strain SS14) TaxID=990650 RepID=A0A0C9VJJ8_SPHS4|nr:hypothetical protein M422DRAFT_255099 [Sphaerobolus stellatus SS14]
MTLSSEQLGAFKTAQASLEHPSFQGAVVEYPESGSTIGQAVAHVFQIDPSKPRASNDLKANIQYLLGESKGEKYDVTCFLLKSYHSGSPVKCTQVKRGCTGYKKCNFNLAFLSYVNSGTQETPDVWQEVFQKTLALFCAIQESGCPFSAETSNFLEYSGPSEEEQDDFNISNAPCAQRLYEVLRDGHAQEKDCQKCDGRIVFARDRFHQPFFQCEHRKQGHQAHLYLRNLQEIDTIYLEALFLNDWPTISSYERQAQAAGFEPLVPCTVICSAREQKMLCSKFHRTQEGKLTRGKIEHVTDCPARFEFYYPNDLFDSAVQKRTIEGHDSELQNSYSELSKLQNEAVKQNATLKHVREDGHDAGPPKSKLRTTEKKYTELYSSLSALQARSSGRVEAPELPHPSLLIPQPPQRLPPLQIQSQQTLWSDQPQGNSFGVQRVSAYSIQSPSTNFTLGSSTTSPSHSSNQVPFRTASTYPRNTITSQQYEFGHEFTYANYSHQGLYQGYPPNAYTPDSHYSPEGSQRR